MYHKFYHGCQFSVLWTPYSGKFLHGVNFRDLRGWPNTTKIRTAKVLMLVRALTLCGVPRRAHVKVSSGASGGVFAKVSRYTIAENVLISEVSLFRG